MAGRQHRNKFGRNDQYYGHDNRGAEFQSNNKGRGFRGKRPFRGAANGRVYVRDDAGNFENNNHRRAICDRSRGRFRKHPNSHMNSYAGWNQILVKNVQGADGDEVIASLRKYVDDDFSPIKPEFTDTKTYSFYLEDNRGAANAMLNLSNRVSLDNGQKLRLCVFEAVPRYQKPSSEQYEIIRKVMSDRFSVQMNRIDLKNFHNDPKLIQSKIFIPLNGYEALTTVVHIITTNIPQVTDIDLSHNKIYNTAALEGLSQCNVKRVSLEYNRIGKLYNILKMRKLELTELSLVGNNICNVFKSQEMYISNVRKIFPKLQFLDGVELPKVIGFEVNESSKMPSILGSQFGSEEAKTFLKQFFDQYYQVYECGNRRTLEAAYTEDACLSIFTVIPDHLPSSPTAMNKVFVSRSRNLMKLTNPEKRYELLLQGRRNIVDILFNLPQSLHDPTSFIIDVPIAQPQLLHVCLRGLFTQVNGNDKVLRSFARSMVIIPVGSGFCISNEELFIGTPSPEQKRAQSQKAIVTSLPPSVPSVAPPSFVAGLADIQIEMIKQFSHHSKLRPQFSKECLEKNEWNFDKAAEIFVSLKAEGKIPIEYYEN